MEKEDIEKKNFEERFKLRDEKLFLYEKYVMEDDISNRIDILKKIIKKKLEEIDLLKKWNEIKNEKDKNKGYNKYINQLEEVLKSDDEKELIEWVTETRILWEIYKIKDEKELLCKKYMLRGDVINRINILEKIIKKEIEELKLVNEHIDGYGGSLNKAINQLEEILKIEKNNFNKYEEELIEFIISKIGIKIRIPGK